MEDREKSKATKPENIVELTPDMEVTDESQVEVIDLTDIVDGPDEIPAFASPVSETPAEAKRPVSRPPTGSIYSSVIEQEVEAAFDFVQSPIQVTAPETPPPANHVGLMDKLSDIPRMVDDALDVSGAPDTRDDGTDDGLAQPADLEEVDTASRPVLGRAEEDDEIIELTDIVDPSELESMDLQSRDIEEIIELTDIVDTAELEMAGLKMDEDDEIIELTDIVDPAELRVSAVIAEPDGTGEAQQTASEATTPQTADAGLEDEEYEDLLEMIDTLDADDLLIDIADEEGRDQESLTAGQEADISAPEDTAATEPELTPDEDQEYAQLLDTIDSLDPEDLLDSVDEAGLLDSGGGAVPDTEQADMEDDGVLTLMDILNRTTANKENLPPVERVSSVIRQVEEETGKDARTLTDQEVEAAVERILKTKYAETIERLIANAVEKAVNREIENLKRTMLDDD